MESHARQQADRLVVRLLSSPPEERARLLLDESPADWDSLRMQAFREALRSARLNGRLSDAVYCEALECVERGWHADGASTTDLPGAFDMDDPTVELTSYTSTRAAGDDFAPL
jgi:hypothetical protein